MDKFFNFFKKNKSKIFVIAVLLFVFIGISSDIFAAINPDSDELKDISWIEKGIRGIMRFVGNLASGIVVRGISIALTAIAGLIYMVISLIWQSVGGIGFPAPDDIIFNRISLFDPNFINSSSQQLLDAGKSKGIMALIHEAVTPIYFTFFIVAGAIMIIAAMIIGIKLALTSIAVEKAQYKEILNKWIIGIVLLFTLHFLILGVFTVNEMICNVASEKVETLTFEPNFDGLMGVVGKVANGIGNFFGGIADFFKGDDSSVDDVKEGKYTGYSGIINFLIIGVVSGSGGGIIYAIILLALLGQTLNLIINYTKRAVFIIFLVILSPLVVAIDVIKRAI